MEPQVRCVDVYGKEVSQPLAKVEIRPSAYGIILHQGNILLCRMALTGKWCLPGGGVERGELLRETVARETHEECGIEIDVGPLVAFQEHFFSFEQENRVFQVHGFLFMGTPRTFDLSERFKPEEEPTDQPQWVPVSSLSAGDFQVFGEKIMAVLSRPDPFSGIMVA